MTASQIATRLASMPDHANQDLRPVAVRVTDGTEVDTIFRYSAEPVGADINLRDYDSAVIAGERAR